MVSAVVAVVDAGRFGGVTETLGGGGGGLAEGFTVLHIGDCDVMSHGGLGLTVVVVVVAIIMFRC